MSFSKGSNHFEKGKQLLSSFFFKRKKCICCPNTNKLVDEGLNPTITTTTSLDLFAPRRSVISV